MIFSLKRVTRLLPIILFILFAVLISTYRQKVREDINERIENAPWLLREAVSLVYDPKEESEDSGYESMLPQAIVVHENMRHPISVVDLALTSEEKRIGLMYRDELCKNCGMLFVYEEDVLDGFWMKNCLIPLDIIFINSSEKIVDIKRNFIPCEDEPCPTHVPDVPYRYVLEVNGGWTESRNIGIDDNIEIPEF